MTIYIASLAKVGWTDKHHLGEKKKETENGCSSGVKYIYFFLLFLKWHPIHIRTEFFLNLEYPSNEIHF